MKTNTEKWGVWVKHAATDQFYAREGWWNPGTGIPMVDTEEVARARAATERASQYPNVTHEARPYTEG